MPTYLYRCRTCGAEETLTGSPEECAVDSIGHCFDCYEDDRDGIMRRVWAVQFSPVMQEHFNPTVGKPISDRKQFDRELHVASELATERTGIPHRFTQVDGSERAQAAGIDPELQAEIARAKREGRSLHAEFAHSTARDVRPTEFASVTERKKHLEEIQRRQAAVNARTGKRVSA
jgi:hypothetical protein